MTWGEVGLNDHPLISTPKVDLVIFFSSYLSSQISNLIYKGTCAHDSNLDPLRVILELINNLELLRVVLEFNTHLDITGRSRTYTYLDPSRDVPEFYTHLDPFVAHSRTYT